MKGKKKDPEFLNSFIEQCVQIGKNTPDDIVAEAQSRIDDIDRQIKEIEKAKIIRSKLLDVVHVFAEPTKDKNKDIRALSFLKIQNINICKHISENIRTSGLHISKLYDKFSVADTNFCIKQMLELKIISKINDVLLRGDAYEDYINFTLGK